MGENLAIDGRLSVRTPMQWTDGRHAGFSTAPTSQLHRPVVEGRFGPDNINVASQKRDSDSLLNWTERMIRRRRETPELGWGEWSLLDADDPAVLAHCCTWEGRTVLAVHNLSSEPVDVSVDVGEPEGATVDDLLDNSDAVAPLHGGKLKLSMGGYGYRWFRLLHEGQGPTP